MNQSETLKFSDVGLSPDLVAVVQELGFTQMTPVQAASIPLLLSGRDLVGQSKTGSGKTAAFALPLLQKIDLNQRRIQALILCPTRELSEQVAREIRRLGRKHGGLQVLLTTGGQPSRPQSEALAKGVHIVVGTPGRVLDHIQRGRMDLSRIFMLVLDEADRMLDMGFEEEMEVIMDEAPGTRQTVFFSATFPPFIKSLSKKYQDNPARISIETPEGEKTDIRQFAVDAATDDKTAVFFRVLKVHRPKSALVFCNHKATVDALFEALMKNDISSAILHGDLEQRDRDRVMAMFRNGSVKILVATDVAARGLDIAALDLVVNFDLPHQPEIYVHRIGRTGRAGESGLAVSLVNPSERARLSDFQNFPGIKLESGDGDRPVARATEKPALHAPAEMRTLVISGGRKDKLRPGDILGALTGDAGLTATQVGKIEVHDTFTYVAIAKDRADAALKSLKAGKIKGKRFSIKFVS